MCMTQSRQKIHANVRSRNLEFKVGDKLFSTKGQAKPTIRQTLRYSRLDRIDDIQFSPTTISLYGA